MSATEEYKIEERGDCIFCGEPYTHWGNNPEPIVSFETGRCCDWCNYNLVIPLRMKRIRTAIAAKE